ncbi:hypothetical protein HUJ04_002462 [Dendroctonus ponderosae]|nr:hypothetical protein HUJ04_002462 [Dendroctonus ponderosae]
MSSPAVSLQLRTVVFLEVPPRNLIVDHPFIFLMRSHDEESSTREFSNVLFIGSINNAVVVRTRSRKFSRVLPQNLTVDHPCIFLVRSHDEEHSTSGVSNILFVGKLSNGQFFNR